MEQISAKVPFAVTYGLSTLQRVPIQPDSFPATPGQPLLLSHEIRSLLPTSIHVVSSSFLMDSDSDAAAHPLLVGTGGLEALQDGRQSDRRKKKRKEPKGRRAGERRGCPHKH